MRLNFLSVPPWHVVCFSLEGWHALATRAGLQLRQENVTESQWPAPDGGLKGTVKRASMWFSASPLGRWAKSGNRVLSVWGHT